jgi:hypothetical protein
MKRFLKQLFATCAAYAENVLALGLTTRDVHIDVPLSNIAVEAFSTGEFIGAQLFPTVDVRKQSDKYYTIVKNSWLRVPSTTLRAPKQSPARVEFEVSSDSYFADNFALASENAHEVIANADDPIQLRARTTRYLVDMLMRDQEVRIANLVTSITNIGSGVVLAGANKWSNTLSDPVADVTTGHAFIRQNTGLRANTALVDADTYEILRRHPVLLDMYKYTQGGLVNDAELQSVLRVDRILISDSIRNAALENATASLVNIWGNNFLLCHVTPNPTGLRTATFGLAFRWLNPELPAPWAVRVYNDPDPGKKVEITEASYYQDEKIVAPQLAYLVNATL